MNEQPLKLNAQLCKHSYNEATERIARLASYATSRSLKSVGSGDYYSLAEELAKKDLIILSISIRRLAEMTMSASELKSLNLKIINLDAPESDEKIQDNCWNIIGNILHGVRIEIIKEVPTKPSANLWEMIRNREEVDAIFSIRSDKHHGKMFSAVHFLQQINNFLEKAEDILGENRIYVGSLYE